MKPFRVSLLFFVLMTQYYTQAENIYFKFTDGSVSAYSIPDVRNITFSGSLLNLKLNNGTLYSWNISTISNYRYNVPVSIKDNKGVSSLIDLQIYPNPSSGRITINYKLEKPETISIEIYDLQGKLLKKLIEGSSQYGSQTIYWDGTDLNGNNISSGSYYLRMMADKYTVSRSFIVIK